MASANILSPFGRYQLDQTIGYVPNTPTAVTTKNLRLFQIHLNNTSGGSVTYTIQDGQGVTGNIFNAIPLAANSAILLSWPEGQFCSGGLVWSASSASALTASIVGFHVA
jgi:hypothetical protein